MTPRPPAMPRRTSRRAGRPQAVLVQTADTRARRPANHARPHGGGEPRAIALFILMLASIALAFLAR